MNFLNIKYFLAIVDEGSVSAASRKLYITQQALSEQLRKMEDEVGTPLIVRGKKSTLTVAGECVYRDGKKLLQIYEGMIEDIQDITTNRRRKITIGIPTYWTPSYLPELLLRFRRKYPEYEVAVVKRQHTDIEHNMAGVDLYLSSLPLNSQLENIILREHDPFHITFRRDLAEQIYEAHWRSIERELLQTKDLSLLKELPFVVLLDCYGQFVKSLNLIFNEYHIKPVVGFSSESFDLNENSCISGEGAILSTASHVEHLFRTLGPRADDFLTYPIKVSSFETKIAISHPKGLRLHAAEIRFLEEAKKLIDSIP